MKSNTITVTGSNSKNNNYNNNKFDKAENNSTRTRAVADATREATALVKSRISLTATTAFTVGGMQAKSDKQHHQ